MQMINMDIFFCFIDAIQISESEYSDIITTIQMIDKEMQNGINGQIKVAGNIQLNTKNIIVKMDAKRISLIRFLIFSAFGICMIYVMI